MDSTEFTLKRHRLGIMKRRALALLLLMGALYVACQIGFPHCPFLSWPRAFAEAGIVGGLADWFAVVALFRHPFGLPIPHTAILPQRKQHIAKTVAGFVVENFLVREVLLKRMQRSDFLADALSWCRRETVFLAKTAASLLPRLLDSINTPAVAALLHEQIVRQLADLPLAPFAGRILSRLTESGRHEVLLDEGLRLAGQLLGEHRGAIEDAVRREVPLPDYFLLPGVLSLEPLKKSIASWVAERLVERVHVLLTEAAVNRMHPVRQRFTQRVELLIEELTGSPEYLMKGEELKRELLSSPMLLNHVEAAWAGLIGYFREQVSMDGGIVPSVIGDVMIRAAETLAVEPEFGARLNEWVKVAACDWVQAHRLQFEEAIRETIEGWDAAELSRKLELEVGADLQCVRMNGTLIGGGVGLVLHLCSKLFP
jgi:uncharacterized membrane-anchored protein YjiN (DUF445 family)